MLNHQNAIKEVIANDASKILDELAKHSTIHSHRLPQTNDPLYTLVADNETAIQAFETKNQRSFFAFGIYFDHDTLLRFYPYDIVQAINNINFSLFSADSRALISEEFVTGWPTTLPDQLVIFRPYSPYPTELRNQLVFADYAKYTSTYHYEKTAIKDSHRLIWRCLSDALLCLNTHYQAHIPKNISYYFTDAFQQRMHVPNNTTMLAYLIDTRQKEQLIRWVTETVLGTRLLLNDQIPRLTSGSTKRHSQSVQPMPILSWIAVMADRLDTLMTHYNQEIIHSLYTVEQLINSSTADTARVHWQNDTLAYLTIDHADD